MLYDYIVVGLGPTGMTLGLNMLHTDKKVLFIEAENTIGGCWKTNYTDEGYFTEHSPKVLSKTGTKQFNKLLKYINIKPNYKDVYQKTILSSSFQLINKHFLISDIIKLVIYVFVYMISLNDRQLSIKAWCEKQNVSENAQTLLNTVSVAISNTYDKVTMHVFIRFMFLRYQYLINLQQLPKPEEWLMTVSGILKTNPNYTFMMNTSIQKVNIDTSNQTVSEIVTTYDEKFKAKEYVCCVPIRALFTIMKNSNFANWFLSLQQFKHFVNMSSYTGIGFQLHYTQKTSLPENWCWSCFGDWKIIILDRTLVLDNISHDKDIKQVLSCVIVDVDTKSTHTNKSVNECKTKDEILQEGLRQVNHYSGYVLPYPKKMTIHRNVRYTNDFGWESINSSFSYSTGTLPYRGRLKNLYTAGPHNKEEVTIIDTAIQSGHDFCSKILKIKTFF